MRLIRPGMWLTSTVAAAVLLAACSRGPSTGAADASAAPPQPDQAAAAGESGELPQGPAAVQGLPPMHPMTSRDAATAPTEPIPPPPGGLSIADVWAKAPSLARKSVTVRGKVVKFLGGIMERNWIHLQDGSGSATDGTNDLTVTTTDEAKVGDIVTVTGVLATDKDFTAGYVYKAILEQATVK